MRNYPSDVDYNYPVDAPDMAHRGDQAVARKSSDPERNLQRAQGIIARGHHHPEDILTEWGGEIDGDLYGIKIKYWLDEANPGETAVVACTWDKDGDRFNQWDNEARSKNPWINQFLGDLRGLVFVSQGDAKGWLREHAVRLKRE